MVDSNFFGTLGVDSSLVDLMADCGIPSLHVFSLSACGSADFFSSVLAGGVGSTFFFWHVLKYLEIDGCNLSYSSFACNEVSSLWHGCF